MKRMWIGISLLGVLMAAGIALCFCFDALHRPLSGELEAAGAAAIAGNWAQAVAKVDEAREKWEKFRPFTAAVADHEPLEEVDGLFSRLQVLADRRAVTEFAAECRQLAILTEAIADSQGLTWWSLL